MTSLSKKVLGSLSAFALAVVTCQPAAAEPSVSGFVDFGYSYNLNGMPDNERRSFDQNANTLTVQNAELVFQGKSKKDVSYRVDVGYGYDAFLQNASDGFAAGTQVNLQQAYLSKVCPMTGGTFTFGKFVTPFGAEVIEAKDNLNMSRGHLFNFAIPLTHTGVKYDKSFGDLALTAGIVNGWDVLQDNNTSKTLLFQAAKPFGDSLKVVLGGAYGPEGTPPAPGDAVNGAGRSLVDAIVTYTGIEKLTLIGNLDWAVDETVPANPADTDDQATNWMGLALYAGYAYSDTWSFAGRFETFDDDRNQGDFDNDPATIEEPKLNSLTFTVQHKMDDVITRLEFRMDSSDEDIFQDDEGSPNVESSQTTLGFQVIYPF